MRGGGGGGGAGRREEAERCMAIAERLLVVRDLVGSKRFAEQAVEADPLVAGADEILAATEVLLAASSSSSTSRVADGRPDFYALLGLPHSARDDPSSLCLHYRRLALLLRSPRSHPAAEASRLVSHAWSVLSDPHQKSLFDADLRLSSAPPSPPPPQPSSATSFWAACPSCCHVHQYDRSFENRTLRCPNCRAPFLAAALEADPPVVPGTDMYYCSWGFFPLGFPGGPTFPVPPAPSASASAAAPPNPFPPSPPDKPSNTATAATPYSTTPIKATPLSSYKKAVAKKKGTGSGRGKSVAVDLSEGEDD